MKNDEKFIHIDETIRHPWGNIRVQCDISRDDPSLEANLRASIRYNAETARGKEDRVAIEKVIALNFEEVRHLHVDVLPFDTLMNSSPLPSTAG